MELDEKTQDVDGQIERAVSDAKKEQYDADEAAFLEREKNPYYEFVGPEDYGSLSFQYPKTWSQYVAADAVDGGNFEAYFNPVAVEKVGENAWRGEGIYALRVMIYQSSYDDIIDEYAAWVESGDTTSTYITAGQASGTRYDGYVAVNTKGSVFIFKLRDKTVVIRTDSEIFKNDFDKLIDSVKYNP
jgi:hypothetical protein